MIHRERTPVANWYGRVQAIFTGGSIGTQKLEFYSITSDFCGTSVEQNAARWFYQAHLRLL